MRCSSCSSLGSVVVVVVVVMMMMISTGGMGSFRIKTCAN